MFYCCYFSAPVRPVACLTQWTAPVRVSRNGRPRYASLRVSRNGRPRYMCHVTEAPSRLSHATNGAKIKGDCQNRPLNQFRPCKSSLSSNASPVFTAFDAVHCHFANTIFLCHFFNGELSFGVSEGF